MNRRIKDIPESERPREKMRRDGAQSLSDRELLAVLLGRGTEKMDVFALADKILEVFGKARECPSLEELEKIKGVGPARATLISAAIEFARRRIRPEGFKITFPAEVLPLIQHYGDRKQEHFLCISLNGANEVIKTRVVSVGTADRIQVKWRKGRGEQQRFMILGKGMITLAKWQAKGLAFQVEEANRKARKKLLTTVKGMSPGDF